MVGPNPQSPTHVVELRTHGVSGTPPEAILQADHVIQVAGDDLGRFFRRSTVDDEEIPAAPLVGEDGAPVPRLLEAYHWGNLTSGGWRKATGALLFPFALVNIAQWTLPQSHVAKTFRPALGYATRGVMRLIALGLTVLFTVQAELITVDLLGTQCLTPRSTRCLGSVSILRAFRDHPLARSLTATGVLVLIAVLIWFVTRDDLTASVRTSTPVIGSSWPAVASDAFLAKERSGALRALHAMAAFGVAAVLLAGGDSPRAGAWNHLGYTVGLTLALLAAVATFFLNDPSGGWGQSRLIRQIFAAGRIGWVWAGLAIANFLVLAGTAGARTVDGDAPRLRAGEDALLNGLMPALGLGCLIVLVLTAVLALAARGDQAAVPRPFRPWLGGMLAPFAAALAALLAGGLGTAATVLTQNCTLDACKPATLDGASRQFVLPPIYDSVALLWGIVAIIGVPLLVLVAGAGYVWTKHATWHDAAEAVQGRTIDRAWFVGNAKYGAQYVLGGLTLLAVIAGAVALVVVDPGAMPPPARDPVGVQARLQALGVLVLVLGVAVLLKAVRTASKNPDEARILAIMWDVMSFWPAEAHPLVPRGYAQRAVPDLEKRVRAHLAVPGTRVVLCGHSQGSLIVYTVALRIAATESDAVTRLGLVTHGSQLQWIFPRVFPSLLDQPAHLQLMRALGGRWHNVVRFTDPAGGPVLSWRLAAAGSRVDGEVLSDVPLREVAVECCHGVRIIGREHWLPDPVRPDPGPVEVIAAPGEGENLTAAIHGHCDYPSDRHWPHVVAAAAGVVTTP